jgi:hypothetical protein
VSAPAEAILAALVAQLIRKGVLDGDDIEAMAEDIDAEATEAATEDEREALHETAHLTRCLLIEAEMPSESDWNADRARSRFHSIDGGKQD